MVRDQLAVFDSLLPLPAAGLKGFAAGYRPPNLPKAWQGQPIGIESILASMAHWRWLGTRAAPVALVEQFDHIAHLHLLAAAA